MKANHTALATAQGVAEAAQQAIKKQDKAIEDKKVEIKDKEDAITAALKTHVDNYGEKPLANDAEKTYNASEKKWVQAKVDLQDTEDQLDKEEDVLKRITNLKGKFTVETIKNQINPKLVALAEKGSQRRLPVGSERN